MTLEQLGSQFEAARKAHFAVTLHGAEDFEGMRRAGRLAAEVLDLGEAISEQQAAAARACDPTGQAALVGCHGQTLWHRPATSERSGNSWQLLQGPRLASLLGKPVVFDFRAADLALLAYYKYANFFVDNLNVLAEYVLNLVDSYQPAKQQ